jgi:hypothetical protein
MLNISLVKKGYNMAFDGVTDGGAQLIPKSPTVRSEL